jgi:hypothetical protein
MKVFLDDERSTPDGWCRVFWPSEAIGLLESGVVDEISLDHDLGDDSSGTGCDVILWIEEAVALRAFDASENRRSFSKCVSRREDARRHSRN